MKSPGLYLFASGSVAVEDLRPKAATKIALSEVLAARIRQHARQARLVLKHARASGRSDV